MGVVYSAIDTTLDRRVAVKLLAPELATATAAARFPREAKILARLAHPHIVPIYEAREADRLLVYILAFVERRTLSARPREGPLPAQAPRARGARAPGAPARPPREGVVHPARKPRQFFSTAEAAMLAVRGIAQRSAGAGLITRAQAPPRTRAYLAAEQLAGAPVTATAMVYSAARVL